LNLIEATLAAGVRNFVFSSTCATYGELDGVALDRLRLMSSGNPDALLEKFFRRPASGAEDT